jgi:truncated hemoglobin YjbI
MFSSSKRRKRVKPSQGDVAKRDEEWDEFAVLHMHRKGMDDIVDDRTPDGCLASLGKLVSPTPDRSVVGYCSAESRLDWCNANNIGFVERLSITKSLVADKNPDAPLYFWQVYSLTGREPIHNLLVDFYDCIFNDTEEIWFRMGFKNGDKKHHATLQERYWADALGGGAHYPGGEKRINFHHEVNAGHEVMTSDGAERWMFHMSTALIMRGHAKQFHKIDKRIFPCIIDFLETKMIKYAARFGWEFDETPFEELRTHCVE